MRPTSLVMAAAAVAVLAAGCAGNRATGAPSSPPSASTPASPAASPTATPSSAAAAAIPWDQVLKQLDSNVRFIKPDPFANTPEPVWAAKVEELRKTLPAASPDQQIVGLASLVGMLDTHSSLLGPFHYYGVVMYRFPDGWYVVRAEDPALVGSKLVSIGGHPAADVEAAMRPLVPADNESGKLDGLEGDMSTVEFLHGLGIVDDPAKPAFVFARPDGSRVTPDLTSADDATWERDLGIIGDLLGDKPEAVARRGEPAWTRLDKATKTFLISYNDYTEDGLAKPLADLRAALDRGAATRVVLDMRYLRGGNGSLAQPLIDALVGDKRINQPGGLTVLIGRENVSAGTVVAYALDTQTNAVLMGETTPARADNFLCRCEDIPLGATGLSVEVPTSRAGNGDPRMAIEPDIPVALTAADFFAGRDPALERAMRPAGTAAH